MDLGIIYVFYFYIEGKVIGNCKRGWGLEVEIFERIGIYVMVV